MINNNFLEDMKTLRQQSLLLFVTKVKKLFYIYNNYASDSDGDVVYENNDDNVVDMLQGLDVMDIINKLYFGHYKKEDAYIVFDGYGNIKTLHYESFFDLYINDDDFISYCNENDINLYEESKGQ